MDFKRQRNIFNPEKANVNVTIIGAGSTGSFVAFTLAKMGINDITVIDFDKIEEHNLPNQYYKIHDVGKYKVDALKEIINEFAGFEIKSLPIKIDRKFEFEYDLNTIFINCVDNMKTRKIVSEILEDLPIKMIDTRFGGEGYSIHTHDFGDEENYKRYLETLKGDIKETSCGEKAIIYTINSLASEVCNIVKKMSKNEEVPELLRRELKTYRFIQRCKGCEKDNKAKEKNI